MVHWTAAWIRSIAIKTILVVWAFKHSAEKVKESIYGQRGAQEQRSGYEEVALFNVHSYDNIDSNPMVRMRKQELMNFFGQYEGEKGRTEYPSFTPASEVR